MRLLSSQAFNRRRDGVYARLDRLGRVDCQDLGADREAGKLLADLVPPDQDPGWPDEARFQYQERWRRSAPGWVRVRSDCDHCDLLNGGRRGYHFHPLGGREAIPHATCVRPDGTGASRPSEAHQVDLLAVHEEFEAQDASGGLIDCRGLRPLG